MKRIFVIFWLLSLILYPKKIDISILKIEPIGVSKSLAGGIDILLQNEFLKYPVFRVIEREKLDKILNEQKIQLSGLTTTDGAVKIGKVLNAKKIVLGRVSNFGGKYIKYILTLKVLDVESGVVEFAVSKELKNKDELKKAVSSMVKSIAEKLNIEEGIIQVIRGNHIYIDIGKNQGVEEGELLTCYSLNLIKDREGRVIMKEETPVAIVKVIKVDEEGAKCISLKGNPNEGNVVKPGSESSEKKGESIVVIKSIPDNAKAYLNGEYIGETPIETSMKPGDYTIELRKPGYSSYKGKIRLRSRRKVIVQKELKRIIELEDIFGGGNIPREKTNPKTALLRAFIPGLGQMYNGNNLEGQVIQLKVALNGVMSALLLSSAFNSFKERNSHNPDSPDYWVARGYWDYDRRGKTQVIEGSIFASYMALLYIYSIIGSCLDASAEFQDLSYFYLLFGGSFERINIQSTPDNTFSSQFNDLINNMSGDYPSGLFGFGLSSKRIGFLLKIAFSNDLLYITYKGDLAFPLSKKLSLLLSTSFFSNQSNPPGFDFTTESSASPLIGEIVGIGGGMRYETPRTVLNIRGMPFAVGAGWSYIEESSSWATSTYISGLRGWYADLSFTYYKTINTGVNIDIHYTNLKDVYKEMQDAGFSTIRIMKDFMIDMSIVYRF